MVAESAVEEIKSRLDIVELVADYVRLKPAGQNHKGLCPFHPEKTPSFMVNRAKQIFHCFGCGAGGDIFGFVMKHENLSFPEALELLAKRAGVELKPRSPQERGLKEQIKAANREAAAFFVKSLSTSRQAMSYLERRGVSEEARKVFSIGFAPEGWHALSEHLKKKGFNEALIRKAGLTATGQKGPYDIFRGRLMFPIEDMHGDVIAFGGRVIGEGEPKYLNSPDTPVFHKRSTLYALNRAKDAIREADEALVVEGYMDAIACHQHGITNAVAPLGTALTAEHVRALRRYASRLMLLFDGDQAGVGAARRSLEIIAPEGLPARVLLLPGGEDPDSLLRKEGAERMRAMLSGALSPVEFVLRTSGGAVERGINEAIALIAKTEDPIRRGELAKELAERTGRHEGDIREKLGTLRRTGRAKEAETAAGGFSYNEETLLLSVAIAMPERVREILGRISTAELRDPIVRAAFERLESSGDLASAEAPSGAEQALVSRLSIEPGFDMEEADSVINDCVRKMERRRMDARIEEARSAGDMALLGRLLDERKRLLQEA